MVIDSRFAKHVSDIKCFKHILVRFDDAKKLTVIIILVSFAQNLSRKIPTHKTLRKAQYNICFWSLNNCKYEQNCKGKKIAIFPKILHEVLKIPREALKIPREALKIPPRGAYDVTRPTFRKARFGKSENPPARRILAEPGTRPIFRKNGFSGFYGENGFAQQSDIDFRVLWVKRNDSI